MAGGNLSGGGKSTEGKERAEPQLMTQQSGGSKAGQQVELQDAKGKVYDVLELQDAVIKAGLRSALASQELKRAAPVAAGLGKDGKKKKKPRKERAVNVAKATNAHMAWLFQGEAPKNIDER